jgi:hypothetical protein
LKALVQVVPLFLRRAHPRAERLAQWEWPGVGHAHGRARVRRVGRVADRHPDFVPGPRDSIPLIALPVKPFSREHGGSAGKCNGEL